VTSAEAVSGIPLITGADDSQLAHADTLVDRSLRRATPDWAPLDLPPAVQDLAARAYDALGSLADGDGDLAALDDLRAEYAATYATAEALSRSSQRAARVEERRKARRQTEAPVPAASPLARARGKVSRLRHRPATE
jgi:hypothetical protein